MHLAGELLRDGGSVRFRAHGRSMQPFIRDGDIVIVEQADAATLRVGDVVLRGSPGGGATVHRIVRQERRDGHPQWVTRGDALFAEDPVSPGSSILGRVCALERRGGRLTAIDRGLPRAVGVLWLWLTPVRRLARGARRRLARYTRSAMNMVRKSTASADGVK